MKKRILLVLLMVFFSVSVFGSDKPVSQLSAITTMADDDLLIVSQKSGGNYLSKKITYANFLAGIAGCAKVGCSLEATDWRAFLGLEIGSDVQAHDADLTIYAGITPSTDMQAFLGAATDAAALTELGGWGVSGSITDEYLVCAETTGGNNLLKSCGSKVTYTEPGTNIPICKTGANTTGGCTNITDVAYLPAAGTGLVEKLAVFAWDGGASAVATASSKRCVILPYAATVTGVYAIADASTTTHIHVYQDAFATGARATTVTGAVDIEATLGSVDTTLTSWDKSITAADEMCMSVESNNNAKWLNITVYGTR